MLRHRRTLRLTLAAGLAGAACLAVSGHVAAATPGHTAAAARDLCAAAVTRQERRHGIPKRLLTAISLVESGRWDASSGAGTAWPWTVTAQGKGRFFPTRAAAIAEVRRLRAKGITSIDVGCMQVNLHYHPDAFPNLNAAFDPTRNADYAAQFLTTLKKDHGSWREAVQHYHSATAKKHIPYQKKVYAAWRKSAPANNKAAKKEGAGRIHKISRQIEREHRKKLSEYRRTKRQTTRETAGAIARKADGGATAPRFLSSWPPRDARAQFRAQNLARAWAFGGSARNVR